MIALLLSLTFWESSLFCQDAPPPSYRSLSQMRRNYPGGRDDSDLTVQVLPQIQRKSQMDQELPLDSEGGDFEVMDSSTPDEGD